MKRIKQIDKNTLNINDEFYVVSHTYRSKIISFVNDQEKDTTLVVFRTKIRGSKFPIYGVLNLPTFINNAYLWSELDRSWANCICDSFKLKHLF